MPCIKSKTKTRSGRKSINPYALPEVVTNSLIVSAPFQEPDQTVQGPIMDASPDPSMMIELSRVPVAVGATVSGAMPITELIANSRNTGMALTDTFFEEDTIHTKVKRFMYMRHLQAFVPITLQSGLRAIIYDAFAGPGRYGENWPDAVEDYGSPLLALRVVIEDFIRRMKLDCTFNKAQQVNVNLRKCETLVQKVKKNVQTSINKSITMPDIQTDVVLNFSEVKEEYYSSLLVNIIHVFKYYGIELKTRFNPCGVITVTSLDSRFSIGCNISLSKFTNTHLPERTTCSRCMTFIDPFGFSQIPMSHIQKFIGKNKEVLITFMSGFLNRFKTIDRNTEAVKELFGFRDDESDDDGDDVEEIEQNSGREGYDKIRRKFRELMDASREDGGINNFVEIYEQQLKKKAGSDFILTFEIRNIRNIRFCHLIFITNHRKGLETMKEAMNRGTQSQESLSLSEYQILRKGIPLYLGNGQENSKVAETIFNKFEGNKNVSINDIENFILFDTLFVWRKTPLKILLTEENPRLTKVCDKGKRPPSRRGTFPDHTEWFLTFRNRDALDRTYARNITQ